MSDKPAPTDQSAAAPARKRMSIAIARAAKHTPLSSVMMIVLPLLAVGTIGFFLFSAGMLDGLTEKSKTRELKFKSVQVSTNRVTMLKPSLTRFDKKSRSYFVRAASAERFDDRPNEVILKNINTEVRMQNATDKVFVTADEGTYHSKTDMLDLKSNIEVKSTSGYQATMSTARVWLKEGRLTSSAPVIVYMPSGTVAANGVEMLESGQKIRFLNRARMVIDGKKKKPNGR